jgi:HEPN domain-containing protein
MQDEERLAFIIAFATESFRDTADQDYIMARLAYRLQLDTQFRWNSLQAVEKYLKAILLYNGESAKNIGHSLIRALDRVRGIPDLGFGIPEGTMAFIEYLNNFGDDRYLSFPTHVPTRALIKLDRTVWLIRKYCFYMRHEFRTGGRVINNFELYKRQLADVQYEKRPISYRLANGYLEKVIDKGHPAYDALVWKNFYFGRVAKHRIKFGDRISMTNPTHFINPECFEELKERVDFPKDVIRKFSGS